MARDCKVQFSEPEMWDQGEQIINQWIEMLHCHVGLPAGRIFHYRYQNVDDQYTHPPTGSPDTSSMLQAYKVWSEWCLWKYMKIQKIGILASNNGGKVEISVGFIANWTSSCQHQGELYKSSKSFQMVWDWNRAFRASKYLNQVGDPVYCKGPSCCCCCWLPSLDSSDNAVQ